MEKKLRNKKGFSLVELIVTIAIIGILVMLATPRFMGYVEKAELARIQHDVKIMEGKMEEELLHGDTNYNEWSDNAKDLRKLILAEKLFENEGLAKNIQRPRTVRYGDTASSINLLGETSEIDFSDYKVIPSERKTNISSSLPGTFYSNRDGKVYYEHGNPLTYAKEDIILGCEAPEPLDYEFDEVTGTIVKYHGNLQHIVIPSSFKIGQECYVVKVIGVGAFQGKFIKNVILPGSVIRIESSAFKDNKIENIVIPPSISHIGSESFSNNNITSNPNGEDEASGSSNTSSFGVVIQGHTQSSVSNGSLTISANAFGGNESTGSPSIEPVFQVSTPKNMEISVNVVTSNNGVKSATITEYKGNDSSVTIPSTITIGGKSYPVIEIAEGAYQGKGIISLILPEGLERIEDYAFAGNQLVGADIPTTVSHVGNYAFSFNEVNFKNKTKATIKNIGIQKGEHIDKLDKEGNIAVAGRKINIVKDITKLLDHIFATSLSSLTVEIDTHKGAIEKDILNISFRVNNLNENSSDEELNETIELILNAQQNLDKLSSGKDKDELRNNINDFQNIVNKIVSKKALTVATTLISNLSSQVNNYQNDNNFNSIDDLVSKIQDQINKLTKDTKRAALEKQFNDLRNTITLFKDGYISISSLDDLRKVRSNLSGNYIQTRNIHVGGAFFQPIGGSQAFTGSYDGGGYTINGLVLNDLNLNHVGLFGYTNKATIKNVGITNVDFRGAASVGGLIGYSLSSTISNSYVTGKVSGHTNIGGLIGYSHTSTVDNSYSKANTEVFLYGGTGSEVGGGLIGANNSSTVRNSYATGTVKAWNKAGGLIGSLVGDSYIISSYATGYVSISDKYNHIGGLIGIDNTSGRVINSYHNRNYSGQDSKSKSGKYLTNANMKVRSYYSGWDFDNIWKLNSGVNDGYPTLR